MDYYANCNISYVCSISQPPLTLSDDRPMLQQPALRGADTGQCQRVRLTRHATGRGECTDRLTGFFSFVIRLARG